MISKLDLQRFSVSELAMGGMALATVALVTLIDLRAFQPPDPSSAHPQSPLDQSRLETTRSISPPPSEPYLDHHHPCVALLAPSTDLFGDVC
jgi:hypothetical protein